MLFGAIACQPTDQSVRPVTHDPAAAAAAAKSEKERRAKLAALEADAHAAMAAGERSALAGDLRTAVTQFTAALGAAKQLETDGPADAARARLLETVGKLAVAPAVPEAARKHGIRGEVLLQRARNKSDFARAVREFRSAVDAAPWWSSAYYNLALAREGSGDAIGAITAYRQFLIAEPGAREAPTIRNRIVALGIDAEDQARPRTLTGFWRTESGSLVRSDISEGNLIVTAVAPSQAARKAGYKAGQVYFEGTPEGERFTGRASLVPCGDGAHATCRNCLGDMRQFRATATLSDVDRLSIAIDDIWITQWNIYTCAVMNKERFKREDVYTRDKEEQRSRAGS
jgi:tetratricopeptide (TPR) repeat protein